LDGTVLWSELVEVSTEYGPDGSATQDAGLWWDIIEQEIAAGNR